jgi:tetratricopeptide (TPR) repeat protein
MAEVVKPATEAELGEYLRHNLNYNKLVRAINALRAMNLVVIKRQANEPDALELHPVVRQFVRKTFTVSERATFISEIVKVYQRFMGNHRAALQERPSLAILLHWTESSELHIAAGHYAEAFAILADASDAFQSSAYLREFCRTARILFDRVDWVRQHRRYKFFEKVFRVHLNNLSYLGSNAEVDSLLNMYAHTVPEKDARYINYCDLQAFVHWTRQEFDVALRWAREGNELKTSTGVDTGYDVSHQYALCQRDAGYPELALQRFLEGRKLDEVTDPDELNEDKGGHHYGNIGRCLHFMGQFDTALICYQKSALLIERELRYEHVLNQGYVRAWVGELLMTRGQYRLAEIFCRAAMLIWEKVSPPKAERIAALCGQLRSRTSELPPVETVDVERTCLDWILGRSVEPELSSAATRKR